MVPVDWTITKAKAAQLFSQMPEVRMLTRREEYAAAVPVYAKLVNTLLAEANVEAVINECVVDCVNAAGVGAAIVRYESLTELRSLPAVDMELLPPEAQMAAMQGALEIPMEDTPIPTDWRIVVDRVSPGDLLWPTTFRLSDWNKAPWLGHSARGPWPKVKRMFNLDDAIKDQVVNAGTPKGNNQPLTRDNTKPQPDAEIVEYDEVFYWRYLYHEDEKYYDAIQRVVFVAGLDEPVINEPWKGQKFDEETGSYIGSCLLPIRVLTLAYISDEAIPPSDSAIIRPLVKELQQGRQHMKEQRKHSLPLRWFDVDRVDPSMTGDLIRGTWQGMIPTIGAGDKVIGEVSRSSYPRENLEMDRLLEMDIQKATNVGPNQASAYSSGEAKSASEAQIVHASFQTEMGQQRAKVGELFLGIAQVVAGLFALYGDLDPEALESRVGPEGVQKLATWDRTSINQKFVFDVRSDSMVRLDAQQLVQQLNSVLNITAQSGFVNPKGLIKRILEASGVDPGDVLVDPQPKAPEPPKMSYSFKGEDLNNVIALAIIMGGPNAPTIEEINAAKAMLTMSTTGGPGAGAPGGAPAGAPQAPGLGGPPPPPPPPGQTHPPVTDPAIPDKPFPNWEANPRINTRRFDG